MVGIGGRLHHLPSADVSVMATCKKGKPELRTVESWHVPLRGRVSLSIRLSSRLVSALCRCDRDFVAWLPRANLSSRMFAGRRARLISRWSLLRCIGRLPGIYNQTIQYDDVTILPSP